MKLFASGLAVALSLSLATASAQTRHRHQHWAYNNPGDVIASAVPMPPPKPPVQTSITTSPLMTIAEARANPLKILQGLSINDLQAALKRANEMSPPDTVAADCYASLIVLVQRAVPVSITGVSPGNFEEGQFRREQKAVNSSLQSSTGLLSGLNIACAPWVLDPTDTLVAIGRYNHMVQ
jgi:hypothetical protein